MCPSVNPVSFRLGSNSTLIWGRQPTSFFFSSNILKLNYVIIKFINYFFIKKNIQVVDFLMNQAESRYSLILILYKLRIVSRRYKIKIFNIFGMFRHKKAGEEIKTRTLIKTKIVAKSSLRHEHDLKYYSSSFKKINKRLINHRILPLIKPLLNTTTHIMRFRCKSSKFYSARRDISSLHNIFKIKSYSGFKTYFATPRKVNKNGNSITFFKELVIRNSQLSGTNQLSTKTLKVVLNILSSLNHLISNDFINNKININLTILKKCYKLLRFIKNRRGRKFKHTSQMRKCLLKKKTPNKMSNVLKIRNKNTKFFFLLNTPKQNLKFFSSKLYKSLLENQVINFKQTYSVLKKFVTTCWLNFYTFKKIIFENLCVSKGSKYCIESTDVLGNYKRLFDNNKIYKLNYILNLNQPLMYAKMSERHSFALSSYVKNANNQINLQYLLTNNLTKKHFKNYNLYKPFVLLKNSLFFLKRKIRIKKLLATIISRSGDIKPSKLSKTDGRLEVFQLFQRRISNQNFKVSVTNSSSLFNLDKISKIKFIYRKVNRNFNKRLQKLKELLNLEEISGRKLVTKEKSRIADLFIGSKPSLTYEKWNENNINQECSADLASNFFKKNSIKVSPVKIFKKLQTAIYRKSRKEKNFIFFNLRRLKEVGDNSVTGVVNVDDLDFSKLNYFNKSYLNMYTGKRLNFINMYKNFLTAISPITLKFKNTTGSISKGSIPTFFYKSYKNPDVSKKIRDNSATSSNFFFNKYKNQFINFNKYRKIKHTGLQEISNKHWSDLYNRLSSNRVIKNKIFLYSAYVKSNINWVFKKNRFIKKKIFIKNKLTSALLYNNNAIAFNVNNNNNKYVNNHLFLVKNNINLHYLQFLFNIQAALSRKFIFTYVDKINNSSTLINSKIDYPLFVDIVNTDSNTSNEKKYSKSVARCIIKKNNPLYSLNLIFENKFYFKLNRQKACNYIITSHHLKKKINRQQFELKKKISKTFKKIMLRYVITKKKNNNLIKSKLVIFKKKYNYSGATCRKEFLKLKLLFNNIFNLKKKNLTLINLLNSIRSYWLKIRFSFNYNKYSVIKFFLEDNFLLTKNFNRQSILPRFTKNFRSFLRRSIYILFKNKLINFKVYSNFTRYILKKMLNMKCTCVENKKTYRHFKNAIVRYNKLLNFKLSKNNRSFFENKQNSRFTNKLNKINLVKPEIHRLSPNKRAGTNFSFLNKKSNTPKIIKNTWAYRVGVEKKYYLKKINITDFAFVSKILETNKIAVIPNSYKYCKSWAYKRNHSKNYALLFNSYKDVASDIKTLMLYSNSKRRIKNYFFKKRSTNKEGTQKKMPKWAPTQGNDSFYSAINPRVSHKFRYVRRGAFGYKSFLLHNNAYKYAYVKGASPFIKFFFIDFKSNRIKRKGIYAPDKLLRDTVLLKKYRKKLAHRVFVLTIKKNMNKKLTNRFFFRDSKIKKKARTLYVLKSGKMLAKKKYPILTFVNLFNSKISNYSITPGLMFIAGGSRFIFNVGNTELFGSLLFFFNTPSTPSVTKGSTGFLKFAISGLIKAFSRLLPTSLGSGNKITKITNRVNKKIIFFFTTRTLFAKKKNKKHIPFLKKTSISWFSKKQEILFLEFFFNRVFGIAFRITIHWAFQLLTYSEKLFTFIGKKSVFKQAHIPKRAQVFCKNFVSLFRFSIKFCTLSSVSSYFAKEFYSRARQRIFIITVEKILKYMNCVSLNFIGFCMLVSGKLSRRPRAKKSFLLKGLKPALNNLDLKINYIFRTVRCSFGSYGVKMWLYYI